MATAESVLRAAGNLFGGIFGEAANASYEVNRLVNGPAHDAALSAAVVEIKPLFLQCKRCGQWRCEQMCWNPKTNLCKECTPIAEDEEAAIRAQHVTTQVANDLFLEENQRMSKKAKEVNASCAHCGADTGGRKFCPECGKPTEAGAKPCPKCGPTPARSSAGSAERSWADARGRARPGVRRPTAWRGPGRLQRLRALLTLANWPVRAAVSRRALASLTSTFHSVARVSASS